MHRRTLLKLLSGPVITGFQLGAAEPRPHRVVISGAGIIGASIAYHLAQRGAQVTILEKQRPGSGATRNSFAWLNASKQPRSYYELNLMGMLGWRRLCTEIGHELQVQWGGSVRWVPPGPESRPCRKGHSSSSSGAIRSASWTRGVCPIAARCQSRIIRRCILQFS